MGERKKGVEEADLAKWRAVDDDLSLESFRRSRDEKYSDFSRKFDSFKN